MTKDEITKLVGTVGAIAELAHAFYSAMIHSGASKNEALCGMAAFVIGNLL